VRFCLGVPIVPRRNWLVSYTDHQNSQEGNKPKGLVSPSGDLTTHSLIFRTNLKFYIDILYLCVDFSAKRATAAQHLSFAVHRPNITSYNRATVRYLCL
jgi:hypothetical protein